MRTRTRILSALLTVSLTACVSNPARRLTPNAEEIFIREASGPEADGKPRPFGFGVYLLSRPNDAGKAVLAIPDERRQYALYATYAGLPLTLLGGYMLGGKNKDRARGVPMTFSLEHAKASLDRSLYGESGASPSDIRELSFNAESGTTKLCASGDVLLTPLQALDSKGRKMRLDGHADWFTWSTTPEVELSGAGGGRRVHSPATRNRLGKPSRPCLRPSARGRARRHPLPINQLARKPAGFPQPLCSATVLVLLLGDVKLAMLGEIHLERLPRGFGELVPLNAEPRPEAEMASCFALQPVRLGQRAVVLERDQALVEEVV